MSCKGQAEIYEHKDKDKDKDVESVNNRSSSSLKSASSIVKYEWLRLLLCNLYEVLLGTKLSLLFPLVPLAMLADRLHIGNVWVFIISLLGLAPLAERLGFITEQIAFYTGPTVGGLLNATCGNATEMIIAIFALYHGKNNVVKYSLLGSVLSNLLLVLGTSLFCGGLSNMRKEQNFDRTASGVTCSLLMMASLCVMLPLALKQSVTTTSALSTLKLSRATSIIMLLAYGAYLFFQLKTHRQLFDEQQDNDQEEEEEPCLGFISSIIWLCAMTVIISILSQYVVETIEDVAESWGISVSFISIILLPIVGNAAEHAGAVLCAFKNKLDISLGIAMGSATQIAMFVIPFITIVAWIMGRPMDLDFHLLETVVLFSSVVITACVLQDGSSNYLKGIVLLLCYFVIAACFFLLQAPLTKGRHASSEIVSTTATATIPTSY